ncbi:MAG: hypothetical protein AABX32_03455 [Nanoarchaeota archaeon]
MNYKKLFGFVILMAMFSLFAPYANAVSIGISPGRVKFENVLRGGYSERAVTISTGGEEELFASYRVSGDIKDWLRFEPNSTTFNLSRGSPYKLKIIIQPPPDVRLGNYSGSIEFITEGIGGVPGRAGAVIKTAVTLLVNIEVGGKEIINCRAGGFNFNDAEVGFPFEFDFTMINDGNVRLKPTLALDIWDQPQENLLLSRKFAGDEVLPTTQKIIHGTIPNNLKEGQYWVNMGVEECKVSSFSTFSVVEKGGIVDKGDLKEIINKPWAYTNETIQIKAKFENSGKRSVSAKFKGVIKLDDRVVKLIETEEIIVPAGQTSDFDLFFQPEAPGRYVLTGRVIYNKKLTFEKGTVLNVNTPPEEEKKTNLTLLPLLIYATIIVTILFIMRKIFKEKTKF